MPMGQKSHIQRQKQLDGKTEKETMPMCSLSASDYLSDSTSLKCYYPCWIPNDERTDTCSGMVEYSLDLQNINLSAIRTVRVLRPLKAINRVPMRGSESLFATTPPAAPKRKACVPKWRLRMEEEELFSNIARKLFSPAEKANGKRGYAAIPESSDTAQQEHKRNLVSPFDHGTVLTDQENAVHVMQLLSSRTFDMTW
uniref:Uncharacterized protein n=1 Tax=Sphaerodactylus townsendi TaxID=933632 RepID=A0ACB8FMY4_9SAUR